jgi:hypothetical protein
MNDSSQAAVIQNLRERHATQIRENAERISEHIGYLLKRLDAGRPDSVGLYAEDISSAARRISLGVAALEAIIEATR